MNIDNNTIKPYIGIGEIKLGSSFNNIVTLVKNYNLSYDIEQKTDGKIIWKIINVKNYISFSFANDVLWQICFKEKFKGKLDNSICLNMNLIDAKKIDCLEFDDWNEHWYSKKGYWIFDDVNTGKIKMISIFIKECERDDEFYKYKWIDKYK